MRLLLIAAAIALSGCATTMQPGLDALGRNDLNSAEQNFTAALNSGETMAWNNLGVVYERRGDRQKAITYYTMAARWGHQIAQNNLARLGAPIPAADLAAQRQQARNAQADAMLNLANQLNRPAPAMAPIPFPTTTTCRSYWVGNQVRTDCN